MLRGTVHYTPEEEAAAVKKAIQAAVLYNVKKKALFYNVKKITFFTQPKYNDQLRSLLADLLEAFGLPGKQRLRWLRSDISEISVRGVRLSDIQTKVVDSVLNMVKQHNNNHSFGKKFAHNTVSIKSVSGGQAQDTQSELGAYPQVYANEQEDWPTAEQWIVAVKQHNSATIYEGDQDAIKSRQDVGYCGDLTPKQKFFFERVRANLWQTQDAVDFFLENPEYDTADFVANIDKAIEKGASNSVSLGPGFGTIMSCGDRKMQKLIAGEVNNTAKAKAKAKAKAQASGSLSKHSVTIIATPPPEPLKAMQDYLAEQLDRLGRLSNSPGTKWKILCFRRIASLIRNHQISSDSGTHSAPEISSLLILINTVAAGRRKAGIGKPKSLKAFERLCKTKLNAVDFKLLDKGERRKLVSGDDHTNFLNPDDMKNASLLERIAQTSTAEFSKEVDAVPGINMKVDDYIEACLASQEDTLISDAKKIIGKRQQESVEVDSPTP